MFEDNGFEIALINTDGLWYAHMTHLESGLKYETSGYDDRNICKAIASLLASSPGMRSNLD